MTAAPEQPCGGQSRLSDGQSEACRAAVADSGRAAFSCAPPGGRRSNRPPRGAGHGSLYRRLLQGFRNLMTKLHPATGGCGACLLAPPSRKAVVPLHLRACRAPEPDFPVDVVYSWVNGSDPAHAAKRAMHLPRQTDIHDNGLDAARFRDNEELRYSLRSLHNFAPWVRTIFVVTDEQTPSWLRTEHPRVRIVDHREFIPGQHLPTFNSHVIEAYLHTIPGLAAHYIYMNDDLFLGRPCRKTDFFTPNGLPLVFLDWRWRRRDGYRFTKTPHAMSYFNTLGILKRRGVSTDRRAVTAHGPFAQTLDNAREAFFFYRDVIEGFAGNRFRTDREVAFYSHALPLLLYKKKRFVPCDERFYYVQTDRVDRMAYYQGILNNLASGTAPLFFCINDVGDNTGDAQWRKDLRALLTAYFPEPSPFERN